MSFTSSIINSDSLRECKSFLLFFLICPVSSQEVLSVEGLSKFGIKSQELKVLWNCVSLSPEEGGSAVDAGHDGLVQSSLLKVVSRDLPHRSVASSA